MHYALSMERELRSFLPGGRFSGVPSSRSKTMRAVKGQRNRSTELRLRAALMRAGIRGWSIGGRGLPGTPDFVFPRHRVAVFADGCFWHACGICCQKPPRANAAFWSAKMALNRAKDRRHTCALQRGGWHVIRVWEHDIRDDLPIVVARIKRALRQRQ